MIQWPPLVEPSHPELSVIQRITTNTKTVGRSLMETSDNILQQLTQKIKRAIDADEHVPQLAGDLLLSVKFFTQYPNALSESQVAPYLCCFQNACELLVDRADEAHYIDFLAMHYIEPLRKLLQGLDNKESLIKFSEWVNACVPYLPYGKIRQRHLNDRKVLSFASFLNINDVFI